MKKKIKMLTLLMLILLGGIGVCRFFEENSEKQGSTATQNNTERLDSTENSAGETFVMLEGNIRVSDFGRYIGGYVEDGSDEFVENVAKIVLENAGDTYIQLAQVTVNDRYVFEVTTLFPGEKVMVLEKNRTAYEEGAKITSAEIGNVAIFNQVPTLCEDILKIDSKGELLTVSNVSGKEFQGGKLFYKNRLGDSCLGGITYFITLPSLAEGQSLQISSAHFQEETSELLFVTYAE